MAISGLRLGESARRQLSTGFSTEAVTSCGRDERRIDMFIVVHHTIADPEPAFTRGQDLLVGNGAPPGVRVREFYPSRDRADVFCLWEGKSLEEVRDYVDATMGDSSRQAYFEVDTEIARGLPELAASRA
jgi:hypothetical protein